MSSPLRPQFFCARPNGALVPLIAVDELPNHVNIRSAPRVLSPGDTQGMTSLGTVGPRCSFYVVESTLPFSRFQFPVDVPNVSGQRAREYGNQGPAPAPRYMPDENGVAPQQRLPIQPMYPHGNGQNWAIPTPPPNHGWIVPTGMAAAPNAGAIAGQAAGNGGTNSRQVSGSHPKKEYCSYWIRHGECDYQQQGCLFKHEMPMDRSMLEKLGLRDIPRWYRDKYNVPSLLSGGGNQTRESRALAGLLDDAASDRGARGSRLALNATVEHSDTERNNKGKGGPSMHQPAPLALPGRPGFINASSPRGAAHHGSKQTQSGQLQSPSSHGRNHASAAQNRATNAQKKIDLLSFEPLPDYASAELSRPGQQIVSDPKERAKRDEFLRGLHDMFAATTVPGKPNTVLADTDVFAPPPRTKRAQPKSRRLFQDRPPAPDANGGAETNASDANQIRQQSLRLYKLANEAVKDFDDDDDFFVPSTGVIQGIPRSSESPRHRRSSSTESCLSCSEPSPTAYLNSRARNHDGEDDGHLKPLLPPIGVFTHKNPTVLKRPAVSSSSDDIFGMGGGRAK